MEKEANLDPQYLIYCDTTSIPRSPPSNDGIGSGLGSERQNPEISSRDAELVPPLVCTIG